MRLHFFTVRSVRCLVFLLLTAALLLALSAPALSANYAWRGDGGANNWSVATNWAPPTGPPAAGDTVVFDATTANNLNLDVATPNVNFVATGNVLNGLSFSGNAFNTSSIDISGITVFSGIGFYTQVNLTGPATFDAGSNPSLWFFGPVSNAGHTLTTQGLAPQGFIFFRGGLSGSGGLVINSPCVFFQTQSATYTGPTVLNGGDLSTTHPLASTSYSLNGTSLLGLNASEVLPDTASINLAGNSKLDLDGNNETIDTLSGTGSVDTNGGTLTVGANGGSSTFDGNITDASGTLIKTGGGSFTLNGDTSPEIQVNGGSLILNGDSEDITVTGGGALMGTGSVGGLLTVVSGFLRPGNSIGTFNALGGLDLQGASTLAIEVSGGASDRVDVTGAVNLASGELTVTGTPTIGSVFTIIKNDGGDAVTGTFNSLAEGATITAGGTTYRISYAGGDGNDVTLTVQASGGGGGSTPEPDPEPTPEPDTPPAPSVSQGSGPSPAGSLDGNALSWPYVKGATHYRIYRADCPLCPRREIGRTTENSFVDNTAIPGQPYTYWLRAENGDGLGGYSNWMAAWRYEQNPGRAGDFNGDGVMDLLWWDRATGQVYIWFMNGGQVMNVSAPMEGLDVSQWLLIGTSDFNGDGACDLLWWQPETGEILFWYMQPAMATASAPFQTMSDPITQTMPSHAALSYPGDLNGDGYSDILWRNYSNGEVTIWLMGADGKPMLSGPPIPVDETITRGERPGLSGALQWQVAGLSDANGDGKADVIWQDERNNRLVTWLMDGVNITKAIEENKGLDTVWRLVGLGDLNMDKQADIVWRNEASGEVKAWLMREGKFLEERAMIEGSEEATQWQVKAVGDFCAPGCDDVYCKHSESKQVKILTLDGREFTPTVE